ncbi:MAG: ribonuclease R [Clostridiales bacterium]|nr:ribonuclease R [Clostridiales bacterium]
MKINYEELIVKKIKKSKTPISFKLLLKSCREKNFEFEKFTKAVGELKSSGKISEDNSGFSIPSKKDLIKCEVVRLNKTFGFIKNIETGEDFFVAGRYFKGSMPGDIVLARTFIGRGEKIEAEIIEVLEEHYNQFTGNIVFEFGRLKILPDSLSKFPMNFDNPFDLNIRDGDKVMAKITKRGKSHSDHVCELVSNFGSSLKASVCALSVLEFNGVTPVFPNEVIAEARDVSSQSTVRKELPKRLDLRDLNIFTIDGADTKDIDDAISIEKTNKGFALGVHIADVSYYVTPKSEIDNEAFKRGTSVYYANRVIPMLPKELSNGICSLNPNEERLAFSCLMNIDNEGNLIDYKFAKSVVCSKLKGVYAEINQILAGIETDEIKEKYSPVSENITAMYELSKILMNARIQRGAPQLESVESKLIISEEDICIDVVPRSRGISEEIIEDFMLMANQSAARFGVENSVPFVYRIHEDPPTEKVDSLVENLALLNVPFVVNGTVSAKMLSDVINKTKKTPVSLVVNNLVLRSMAKAKYSIEPIGHFGLVLPDYAHFTSPIRRYPDLTIHRIMTDFLANGSSSGCIKKYQKFAHASAEQSTNTEMVAVRVERDCEDCYKAEFMKNHVGENFEGIIVSVMEFGLFVSLPNTCEGLLHVEELGEGEYSYDGASSLKNMNTGMTYRVGDSIKIKVLNANVSSGKVDFGKAD